MARTRTMEKAVAAGVLRRVGISEETIDRVLAELPDPIDLDRDSDTLVRYGITRDSLNDLMGGSP